MAWINLFERSAMLTATVDGSLGGPFISERAADGAIVTVCVDLTSARMTEVRWHPGVSLSARGTPLSAPVPDPSAISLSDDAMLLSTAHHGSMLIERATGVVRPLPRRASPAVLAPGGKQLVAVTDHGLLRLGLGRNDDKSLLTNAVRPVLVADLDNPRALLIVPGAEPGAFTLVVGCYGAVVVVDVTDFAPGPAVTSVRQITTSKLPYDPLYPVGVPPLGTDGDPYVFICDESRAGLVAMHLATGVMHKCELEDRNYGAVSIVSPRIDSRAAIVQSRDRRRWLWHPGQPPVAIDLPVMPVIWDAERVVVQQEGSLREITLPR